MRSINVFQYPVIQWITIAIDFTVRSSFEIGKVWRNSMCVFESCERERQILQDVDKTICYFLFKKIGKYKRIHT